MLKIIKKKFRYLVYYLNFWNLKINLSKNHKYLFSIGAPRSGTTMLWYIINSHPNVLFANETTYFAKLINENYTENLLMRMLCVNAFKSFLENSAKNYKKFQKKFVFLNLKKKVFKKKKIYLIGDKKSGNLADICKYQLNDFLPHIRNNYFFIHIVRNPIDASTSHKVFENNNNKKNFEKVIRQNDSANLLRRKFKKNFIKIHYEEFLNNPKKELKKIFKRLNIKCSDKWLVEIDRSFQKKNKIKKKSLNKYQKEIILKYKDSQKLYRKYFNNI